MQTDKGKKKGMEMDEEKKYRDSLRKGERQASGVSFLIEGLISKSKA